jgi:hypothetical protein
VLEVTPAPAADTARPQWFARAQSVLWLAVPPLFLAWLYSRSFRIWFREDDFPLLGWVRQTQSFHDFLGLFYLPYAQGTIRPLSERLPFLVAWNLFGEDCVPLRIFVFLTAVADMWLLAWITKRMTGSRLAGCAAAVLWGASAAIITPMAWNSAYNEVQYQVFLLGALALFIRFAETGQRRYWWGQLAVFVLGFGSLENNVVYPAIAAAWAALAADRPLRKRLIASTIPLFVLSAAYYAAHTLLAPAPATGIYAMHVDLRIIRTLWEYWHWSFLAPEAIDFGMSRVRGVVIITLSMFSFVAFVFWQLRARRFAVLFGLAWFLLTLSPMLLLPDRHTGYYLAGPVMGLAMVAGEGVALAWRRGWIWRALMLIPVIAWFSAMIPAVRAATRRFADHSKISRNLVIGVEEAHERHPDKTILLDGVSQDAYLAVIFENGFRAFGIENVYLTPGAGSTIQPEENDHGYEGKVVDAAVAKHALQNDEAVVFDFSAGHLKNTTGPYWRYAVTHFGDAPPHRIQAGNPLYGYLLDPEWQSIQDFVRWMGARATVKIAGPDAPGQRLTITGFCWDELLRGGPMHLAAAADGVSLGSGEFRGPEARFEQSFALPAALVGRPSIEIALTASPIKKMDSREYGLMVESVAIR